jgi:3-oxoacyl-[acyl-carrier protein] reductase
MNKYIDINVGDKAEIVHQITQQDIEKFVELTGDDNKIHTDSEYASTTSFKKPVAHGMLGASFISTIIGTKLPGDGALWYAQSLEFLNPVRIGDKLRITAEVVKKIDRTRTIELQTDIYNQNKQKVTTGTAKIKVVESIEKNSLKEDAITTTNTVLVIGGTGGIGSATCLQLAKDGFDVAIHYHNNRKKAENLKKTITEHGQKAVIVTGNLYSEDDVSEIKVMSERIIGDISVIVNCATIPIPAIKFSDLEWDDLQPHYDSNIKISFNLLKIFSPKWQEKKFGKFIGLTTLLTEQLKPEMLGYITGKTALNGFIKALAFELGPKGIRLNLVSPGMVDTPLVADFPEKVRLLSAAQAPLRVLATPEDIANTIAFLASDRANYLTGETIRVNGGQFML